MKNEQESDIEQSGINVEELKLEAQKKMIKEFQCPGCVCGGPLCQSLKIKDDAGISGFCCIAHVPGTTSFPGGKVAPGLPTGFNKYGGSVAPSVREEQKYGPDLHVMFIRLHLEGTCQPDDWDHLNVPVWAMDKDGYLFIRTYSPRINATYIDVIQNGKREELAPQAIDVAKFFEDID